MHPPTKAARAARAGAPPRSVLAGKTGPSSFAASSMGSTEKEVPVKRFQERLLENLDEPLTPEEEKALELIRSKEHTAIAQKWMCEQILNAEPRCRFHPRGPKEAQEVRDQNVLYAQRLAAEAWEAGKGSPPALPAGAAR